MEGDLQILQDQLIQQQFKILNNPQKDKEVKDQSLWTAFHQSKQSKQAAKWRDVNKHRFNYYADKQLQHLVVSQEFQFNRIAQILNYVFRDQRLRFTQESCRQRWFQLYKLRNNGQKSKQQKLQDKRATSVSAFNLPFNLYNLEEMIDELQKQQTKRQKPNMKQQQTSAVKQNKYTIFTHNIRKIDDMQGYKKRQQQMKKALLQAQNKVVVDKLMHFSPYYDRLNEFQVKQEELTQQKMKQIMSLPIQMQKVEIQLRVKDMNESKIESKIKKMKKQQKIEQYQFQVNEDQYQSD